MHVTQKTIKNVIQRNNKEMIYHVEFQGKERHIQL